MGGELTTMFVKESFSDSTDDSENMRLFALTDGSDGN